MASQQRETGWFGVNLRKDVFASLVACLTSSLHHEPFQHFATPKQVSNTIGISSTRKQETMSKVQCTLPTIKSFIEEPI